MEKHLLFIGFSCTGKTSLGKQVFGDDVIDSDDAILDWIEKTRQEKYDHIYEVYMRVGRQAALRLIAEGEEALIRQWTADPQRKIISLGPGFPLRSNWGQLRAVSYVVLFQRSSEAIYESLRKRRKEIFRSCPEAREHDNWDVGVMVDEQRRPYTREQAIAKINQLLGERKAYYAGCDAALWTDNVAGATEELRGIAMKV